MQIHRFSDTATAYDATQTGYNEDSSLTVRNGHVLVIESEQVVGLCDTWPYAVTEHSGSLHKVTADGWAGMVQDGTVTLEQLRTAAAQAAQLGFPLDPGCAAFIHLQAPIEAARAESAALAQCTYDEAAALGFDQCAEVGRQLQVACSQCNARVIDGKPAHETGCTNARPLRIAVTVTFDMPAYDFAQDRDYITRLFHSIGQTMDPAATISIDAR